MRNPTVRAWIWGDGWRFCCVVPTNIWGLLIFSRTNKVRLLFLDYLAELTVGMEMGLEFCSSYKVPDGKSGFFLGDDVYKLKKAAIQVSPKKDQKKTHLDNTCIIPRDLFGGLSKENLKFVCSKSNLLEMSKSINQPSSYTER